MKAVVYKGRVVYWGAATTNAIGDIETAEGTFLAEAGFIAIDSDVDVTGCSCEEYGSFTPAEPALLALQISQVAALTASCQRAIVSGFQSRALGEEHTYPSDITDQQNLTANVLSSLLPENAVAWTTMQLCCDTSGVWAYKAHKRAQIQQVGSDGKTAIMVCLIKKAGLVQQVQSAQTEEDVLSIQWTVQ